MEKLQVYLRGYEEHLLDWFLVAIIALQPIFDTVTYFIMRANLPNQISIIRMVLLLLFGLFVFLEGKAERKVRVASAILTAAIMLFVAARYLFAQALLPGTGVTEVMNALRVYTCPLLAVWFLCYLKGRPVERIRYANLGIFIATAVFLILSFLSFATSSYHHTYENSYTNGITLGFSGWAYSANAQSITEIALFTLVLASVIRLKPRVYIPLFVAFWVLFYFSGTRAAYYSLMLIPIAIFVIYLIQLALRTERFPKFVMLAMGVFLVLAIALQPYSFLNIVNSNRENERALREDYFNRQSASTTPKKTAKPTSGNTGKKTASASASPSPKATAKPSAQPTAKPSPKPSATKKPTYVPAAGAPMWDKSFTSNVDLVKFKAEVRERIYGLRTGGRLPQEVFDRAVYRYAQQRVKMSAAQIVNERYNQATYVMAFIQEAPAGQLLFGYGRTWFDEAIISVENDYVAILGYYGIVGCILFIAPFLYMLWAMLQKIRIKDLCGWITSDDVVYGVAFCILLGLAYFAGRVFQQASVSIYFSFAAALAVVSVQNVRQPELPPERG